MRKWICLSMLMVSGGSMALENPAKMAQQQVVHQTPEYLYKVVTVENWDKKILISADDRDFIHLATEEQLPRITGKYWSNVPTYVILKVSSSQLKGNLVFEANPGGENKYYHLYNGEIPLKAVVEAKVVHAKQ